MELCTIARKFSKVIKLTKTKPNLSLYSPYYAEACNELRYPSLRHSAKAKQLLA